MGAVKVDTGIAPDFITVDGGEVPRNSAQLPLAAKLCVCFHQPPHARAMFF